MLNGLDLFSGIGGLTIALAPWVRPVAYCENDRYAQAVLLSRMSEGAIPRAPIWDDVQTLSVSNIAEPIDILYGGFPCQDVSVAGARKGLDGERTGLFREAIRLVRECRPQFVFLENVPGIRKYVPTVRQELEALGYDCRDGFLSAGEVGAPHRRVRWWLLAYADSRRCDGIGVPESSRLESKRGDQPDRCRSVRELKHSAKWQAWEVEPELDRMVDGLSFGVDRLRGLGNAVVPLQAREAFKRLMGIDTVPQNPGKEVSE